MDVAQGKLVVIDADVCVVGTVRGVVVREVEMLREEADGAVSPGGGVERDELQEAGEPQAVATEQGRTIALVVDAGRCARR